MSEEQRIRDRIEWHENQVYKLKEKLLQRLKKRMGCEHEILQLSIDTNPMEWD